MSDQTNKPDSQEPVDRARRSTFARDVVAFCLVAATLTTIVSGLGFLATTATLTEIFVRAILGLAMAVSLTYIGGSVVDYNGGIGNILKMTKKPEPTPPSG